MAFESAIPKRAIEPRADNITFIRDDLFAQFDAYDLICDCLAGSAAVKAKRDAYLPLFEVKNVNDPVAAAKVALRYNNYLQRAVFYNVTQRTALGLQGQIFARPPVVKVPKALENVVTDSNGGGISLEQIARDATWYTASYGRGGLFVDYPPTEGPQTKADLDEGNVRPTITVYGPKNVINWQTIRKGSKTVLGLVVLLEEYNVEGRLFSTEVGKQYRELRIVNNQYRVQLWREKVVGNGVFEVHEAPYFPKDGKGQPLKEIPFTFIGAKNNEPSIDPAPLLDLATINIAHYLNSADYEELVFIVGQPTLVVAGLTGEWYKDILKSDIPLGSRSGLALPTGATAELLQVEPNPAAKEAMEHKERQMVALGAKIVEQKTVQRTATESSSDNAAEQSTLVAIAKNVSQAMQWALEWCAVFANANEKEVTFELNTDFELATLSDEQLAKVVKYWQDGATSWTEMRDTMRKAGRTSLPDDEAKAEIEKDGAQAIADAAKQIGMESAAAGGALPDEVDGTETLDNVGK